MALHFACGPFENKAEAEGARLLKAAFSDDWALFTNVMPRSLESKRRPKGFEVDALLVSPQGAALIDVKGWSRADATINGQVWMGDGVEYGNFYQKGRRVKYAVYDKLAELLGRDPKRHIWVEPFLFLPRPSARVSCDPGLNSFFLLRADFTQKITEVLQSNRPCDDLAVLEAMFAATSVTPDPTLIERWRTSLVPRRRRPAAKATSPHTPSPSPASIPAEPKRPSSAAPPPNTPSVIADTNSEPPLRDSTPEMKPHLVRGGREFFIPEARFSSQGFPSSSQATSGPPKSSHAPAPLPAPPSSAAPAPRRFTLACKRDQDVSRKFPFDPGKETPRRLQLWMAEARDGGVFDIAEGVTGVLYSRTGRKADYALRLPPDAPELSVWRLSDGQLARLYFRDSYSGYDETDNRVTANLHLREARIKRGGEIRVRSPLGMVWLTLPPGVEEGDELIVQGASLPRQGVYGDLVLTVRVDEKWGEWVERDTI